MNELMAQGPHHDAGSSRGVDLPRGGSPGLPLPSPSPPLPDPGPSPGPGPDPPCPSPSPCGRRSARFPRMMYFLLQYPGCCARGNMPLCLPLPPLPSAVPARTPRGAVQPGLPGPSWAGGGGSWTGHQGGPPPPDPSFPARHARAPQRHDRCDSERTPLCVFCLS